MFLVTAGPLAVASNPSSASCSKIVEVPLGEFGDQAFAKKFTRRFGPGRRFGALREDTHLRYIGNFATKKQCNLPKVYFSRLHYIENTNLILLESLAGSVTRLSMWDVVACKKLWDEKEFGSVGQPVWYRDQKVIFRPTCWDCNSRPAEEPCGCDAAIVVNMNQKCEFKVDAVESLKVTEKEIGVGFKGHKKVIHRFTPQAAVK